MSKVTVSSDIKYISDQLKYADHHFSDDRFNTALWALRRLEQKIMELEAKNNNEEIILVDPYRAHIERDYFNPSKGYEIDFSKKINKGFDNENV